MAIYKVNYVTTIAVTATVEAETEGQASELAWAKAGDYLWRVSGKQGDIAADVDLKNVEPDQVVRIF